MENIPQGKIKLKSQKFFEEVTINIKSHSVEIWMLRSYI